MSFNFTQKKKKQVSADEEEDTINKIKLQEKNQMLRAEFEKHQKEIMLNTSGTSKKSEAKVLRAITKINFLVATTVG